MSPAVTFAAFPPITDEQLAQFEAIGKADNIAVMSVLLDGQPTVAIVAVVAASDGSDQLDVHPLYIAVDDDLFPRITPPPLTDGSVAS